MILFTVSGIYVPSQFVWAQQTQIKMFSVQKQENKI